MFGRILWRGLSKLFTPEKGHSERTSFSLGDRPALPAKPREEKQPQKKDLRRDLDYNVRRLKAMFHVPNSSDVVFREITCGAPRIRVAIAYIEGLASFDKVFLCILQPLMLLAELRTERGEALRIIESALIPNSQVARKRSFDEARGAMIAGDTVVLVDGFNEFLSVETKGWEHRTVSEAISERIVRGPQHGFTEVLRTNTGLLRSILRTSDLVVENIEIGTNSKNQIALAYIEGIANPKIVEEMKRRLTGINTDSVLSSGKLEQFIETRHSLIPTILSTERPDRVAHFLLEGTVAVLVQGDPFVLIAPMTFFSLLHNPEDMYVRWPYGNALRFIRIIAFFVAILLPGVYSAIVNFHPEMIPTVLIMAIASTREGIPLPLAVEVILMYFSFELIREAGIRIPSPIGPTIGIVGALLIGEAAVSASLVSPIMVIIIAITAVASFTIPNQETAMFVRVATLLFITAGSALGLLGIVALAYVMVVHAVSLTSLGVPFLSPAAPTAKASPDVLYVGPAWKMERMPSFLRPLKRYRQPKISREWDIPESQGGTDVGKKPPG